MLTRYFALAVGIVYLVVGVFGFIPGITQPLAAGDPALLLDIASGRILGLFPVNLLHNIVHLIIGGVGIGAHRRYADSRNYARGLAILYAVLAVLGLIPGLNTMFGLVPLFSHDVWLHALTAAVAAYFGFVAPAEAKTATTLPRARR